MENLYQINVYQEYRLRPGTRRHYVMSEVYESSTQAIEKREKLKQEFPDCDFSVTVLWIVPEGGQSTHSLRTEFTEV